MEIKILDVSAPEVLALFAEYDDFIIDFLGDDRVYYTRYSADERIDCCWVAYDGGEPVGCVAYRVKSVGMGELKRVYVKEKYRGRGVSKQLVAVVEEYARKRGDHTFFLSTRVTLEPAVTLYRRAGFVPTFCEGFYVEMEKKLTEKP